MSVLLRTCLKHCNTDSEQKALTSRKFCLTSFSMIWRVPPYSFEYSNSQTLEADLYKCISQLARLEVPAVTKFCVLRRGTFDCDGSSTEQFGIDRSNSKRVTYNPCYVKDWLSSHFGWYDLLQARFGSCYCRYRWTRDF